MDPISGAASIIGCVEGIQSLLKLLKQIKDAPNELRQVYKEVEDTQQVVKLVGRARDAILYQIGVDSKDETVLKHDDHLAGLEALLNDIDETVRALHQQTQKCLNSKGEFSRLSLSMFKWVGWRKAEIFDLIHMAQSLQSKIQTHQSSIGLIEHAKSRTDAREIKRLLRAIQKHPEASGKENMFHDKHDLEVKVANTAAKDGVLELETSETSDAFNAILDNFPAISTDSLTTRFSNNEPLLQPIMKPELSTYEGLLLTSPVAFKVDRPSSPSSEPMPASDGAIHRRRGEDAGTSRSTGTEYGAILSNQYARQKKFDTTVSSVGSPNVTHNTADLNFSRSWGAELDPDMIFGDANLIDENKTQDAPGSVGNIVAMLEPRAPDDSPGYDEDARPGAPIGPLMAAPDDVSASITPNFYRPYSKPSASIIQYGLSGPAPYDPGNESPMPVEEDRRHGTRTWLLILRTPGLFLPCLGVLSLTLGWHSNPEVSDQARSPFKARLRYTFPSWSFGDIAVDVLQWNGVRSALSSPRLACAREIDIPAFEVALRMGDLAWVRRQIKRRIFLPGDSIKDIGSPLEYVLNFLDSKEGFTMTELLLDNGFRSECFRTSAYNLGASHVAAVKLVGGGLPPHVRALLQRVVEWDEGASLGHSTDLHDAVLERTEISVREILARSQVDVEARDNLGFTALHWAVVRRRTAEVRTLLKHGADVNATTTLELWTPLHLACMENDHNLAAHVIASGAKPQVEDFCGRTPLHFAAWSDDLSNCLVAAGADVFHTDFRGNNALHSLALSPTFRGYQTTPAFYSRERNECLSFQTEVFRDERLWNHQNKRGECPLQIAATHSPGTFLRIEDLWGRLNTKFPMGGRNMLHYVALHWTRKQIEPFWRRHMDMHALIDIDCDALDDQGKSPMDLLELRMSLSEEKRPAGVPRPTRADVIYVVRLLVAAQDRGWMCVDEDDSELPWVHKTKQRVLGDGTARKVRLWLDRCLKYIHWPPERLHNKCETPEQWQQAYWEPETDSWWKDIPDDDSELAAVYIVDRDDEFS